MNIKPINPVSATLAIVAALAGAFYFFKTAFRPDPDLRWWFDRFLNFAGGVVFCGIAIGMILLFLKVI